jgi:hypothetical protein
MTRSLKHSASIEQYLANEMAPDELAAFKNELRTNPELAAELKLSQTIDIAIRRDDVLDLQRKLTHAIQTGREIKADVPVKRLLIQKWMYAAASLLVLCAVGVTMYLQVNRNLSNDSLFT